MRNQRVANRDGVRGVGMMEYIVIWNIYRSFPCSTKNTLDNFLN
jgi:hypothetical protein